MGNGKSASYAGGYGYGSSYYYGGSANYGSYYGSYPSSPFLNASGELQGPGTSAYEQGYSPAYHANQTAYAYETYNGGIYQFDTASRGGAYGVNVSYYGSSNGETISYDHKAYLTTPPYPGGGYYANGYFGYAESTYKSFDSSSITENGNHLSTTSSYYSVGYQNGSYVTEIDNTSSVADANGYSSFHQDLLELYTNSYGYSYEIRSSYS